MHFFSQNRKCSTVGGFTLVELLISVAVIGIVTSIALVKYGTFDSTILLKSAAYEIALGLREAQVRSVSVVKNGASFDYPYGMTFSLGLATSSAFQYKSPTAYPSYDGTSLVDVVRVFTIGRSMTIHEICVTVSGTETCHSTGSFRLDISFRRPEFKALFYATDGTTPLSTTIESAKIKLKSSKGNKIFGVDVSSLGQISVKKY